MTARPVVAMVTDSIHPFYRGGKESRYREVVARLSRHADVHVYTMNWWEGPKTVRLGSVTYHALCPRQDLYVGRRRSVKQALVFGVACAGMARERFDALEADHVPYLPLFVLRAVCSVRRTRFVVTWHEVWGPHAWTDYLGRWGVLAWYVERLAMLTPDVVVAASAETARRLTPYVRRSTVIRVAPNGLDLDAVRRTTAAPSRTDVSFVGRLLPHKNVDILIDAVALLHGQGIDVTCRVVGTGPQLPVLRRRAVQRGVDDLVEFCSDVPDQSDVYALLKASDVFVFPSVREGFGISVLEAIACGLPVVTTDHPDNVARLLVEASGTGIVCPASAPDFAAAISTLLRGPAGVAASEPTHRPDPADLVRGFDWDHVAATVADALGVRGA